MPDPKVLGESQSSPSRTDGETESLRGLRTGSELLTCTGREAGGCQLTPRGASPGQGPCVSTPPASQATKV